MTKPSKKPARKTASYTTTPPRPRRPRRDYDGDPEVIDATDGFCIVHEYTPSGRKGDT